VGALEFIGLRAVLLAEFHDVGGDESGGDQRAVGGGHEGDKHEDFDARLRGDHPEAGGEQAKDAEDEVIALEREKKNGGGGDGERAVVVE